MNKIIITQKEELEVLVKTSVDHSIRAYFKEEAKESNRSENLSVKETAHFLNVAELTVRNYIKKGIISADKIGSRIIINRKKLEDTLKEVKSLKYKRS